MTGGELLYERNADGSWVLYSAGENGQDEDTLGDDIVWPLAGYPERLTDPAPWQTIPREISSDGPSTELVGKLAAEMNLSLRFDPKPTAVLTNHLSVRLEQSTPFEALEGIVGNQGLLLTKGAKHRLNCVIADPFPSSLYNDDITDEPSSGEVCPLIVIDGVPLTDAIRNLARIGFGTVAVRFQQRMRSGAVEHSGNPGGRIEPGIGVDRHAVRLHTPSLTPTTDAISQQDVDEEGLLRRLHRRHLQPRPGRWNACFPNSAVADTMDSTDTFIVGEIYK
jgi:hypothetical protein